MCTNIPINPCEAWFEFPLFWGQNWKEKNGLEFQRDLPKSKQTGQTGIKKATFIWHQVITVAPLRATQQFDFCDAAQISSNTVRTAVCSVVAFHSKWVYGFNHFHLLSPSFHDPCFVCWHPCNSTLCSLLSNRRSSPSKTTTVQELNVYFLLFESVFHLSETLKTV